MSNGFDKTKVIKMLISQTKALKTNINRALNDTSTETHSRFVGFKMYAERYNYIVHEVEDALNITRNTLPIFNTNAMRSYADTLWGEQKRVEEAVALEADMLLSFLESSIDFVEDEFDNIANFIKSRLRAIMYSQPEKENEVQNAIESLFIGRNMEKGIDYDRESGKLEFSGKEYIPDFVLPKMNLCVEVKLLREGKKSRIIDEINADITAYSTKYERLLFVVYDLGVIRDEVEFRRDIENAGTNIKVLIIKH